MSRAIHMMSRYVITNMINHSHDIMLRHNKNNAIFKSKAPFTWVRTNFCTGKNLHGSTLCLHGTGGTGRSFERISVQVWDLKKAVQIFDRDGSHFVRTRVNPRTVQHFAQIASLRPEI